MLNPDFAIGKYTADAHSNSKFDGKKQNLMEEKCRLA